MTFPGQLVRRGSAAARSMSAITTRAPSAARIDGDAATDPVRGARDDGDLSGQRLHVSSSCASHAGETPVDRDRIPPMQRFLARGREVRIQPRPRLDRDGAAGRARSRSSAVEGFGNAFSSPDDFTPERYADAETLKWAVTGPIAVAGTVAGRRGRGDDPLGRGDDAGCRRLRRATPTRTRTSGGTTRARAPSIPRRAASSASTSARRCRPAR